ncbi:heme-dependent oxidative N-demethylase subunit alpha family protein [Piscinibacter sp.]|uniref:heme-dependent oxidative N-demethylase subunit alpha family protein n=1 Tax=Piscinibacter sp. TaxID=1903157 RepID=UPI0039E3DD4C
MPFDFASVSAPFRMQPGLRALAPEAAQLTPIHPGDRAFAEKLAVLTHHADQALLVQPGFDAAPALAALMAQAAREHPQAWHEARTRLPAEPAVAACLAALSDAWRLPALLSLSFAEDFAIIDGASARIPWLAVCLPSQWSPQDKVGRHFAEVHAPVADNRLLLAAGDHLARLVTGTQRWERFVWTIVPEPRLDMHPARVGPPHWRDAAEAFFRTERQTFIPLPEARQAVFTIHVESRPLAEAIATPGQAAAVHAALASMSEAVLAYRGLSSVRGRLLDWLASRMA